MYDYCNMVVYVILFVTQETIHIKVYFSSILISEASEDRRVCLVVRERVFSFLENKYVLCAQPMCNGKHVTFLSRAT